MGIVSDTVMPVIANPPGTFAYIDHPSEGLDPNRVLVPEKGGLTARGVGRLIGIMYGMVARSGALGNRTTAVIKCLTGRQRLYQLRITTTRKESKCAWVQEIYWPRFGRRPPDPTGSHWNALGSKGAQLIPIRVYRSESRGPQWITNSAPPSSNWWHHLDPIGLMRSGCYLHASCFRSPEEQPRGGGVPFGHDAHE